MDEYAFALEIEDLAVEGARRSPDVDKSDWIRVWAAARRFRDQLWDRATWDAALGTDGPQESARNEEPLP